jgi:DNA-binding protein HU-beta
VILDAQAKIALQELAKGGEITLVGLGKLHTADRAARTGRNPGNGEKIDIPAKRVPAFVAAKALKEAVAL